MHMSVAVYLQKIVTADAAKAIAAIVAWEREFYPQQRGAWKGKGGEPIQGSRA
jgi:hypothetical protein